MAVGYRDRLGSLGHRIRSVSADIGYRVEVRLGVGAVPMPHDIAGPAGEQARGELVTFMGAGRAGEPLRRAA
jgi:hypothetical protein